MSTINRGRISVEHAWQGLSHVLAMVAVWCSGISFTSTSLLTALIFTSLVLALYRASWPGIGIVRGITFCGDTILLIGDKGEKTAKLIAYETCGDVLTVLMLQVVCKSKPGHKSRLQVYKRKLILLKFEIGEAANRDLRRLLWCLDFKSAESDQSDLK